MRQEKHALKTWLTGLLPEGLSRNDVAYELNVSRKTVSTMLNPESDGFGNGYTMLRYLRLVGALKDAPDATPETSRLARLQDELEETQELVRRGFEALGVQLPPRDEAPPHEDGQSAGSAM